MISEYSKTGGVLCSACIALLPVIMIPVGIFAGEQSEGSYHESTRIPADVDQAGGTVSDDPEQIEEIIITATRTGKPTFDVPNTAYVIKGEDILLRRQSRTLPEVLKETPGVMVQKTSNGQGSPYIRGFTGYHTLLLIDGIRLNNSVFRSGPNQYWNTVDTASISRLEIIEGPGSVLYGSDAVGGTVNVITIGPDMLGEGLAWGGHVHYRFASADHSNIGRLETSGGYMNRFGWSLGVSLKDFGDVRGGDDVGLQEKTGYGESDGDIKLEYYVTPDSYLTFAHQRVSVDDAWRTHKTIYGISWEGTTVGDEKKRVLDQYRELTYLQYHSENRGGLFDVIRASLSYQTMEEDQFRIKSDDKSDKEGFDVDTAGAWLQLESPGRFGRWTYGVEYYEDSVDSYLRKYNPDGSLSSVEIQGPVADDSSYDLFGLYVQDDIPLLDSIDLIPGVRYTFARAVAGKVKDPVTGREISFSEDWDSVIGSIRLVYHVDSEDHWNLFGGVMQGFRAPNLSDLSRFDTARSNEIETPAPGLDPEEFVSYETGVKTQFDNFSAQLTYYYTDIDNMIERTPTGRIIDGDIEVTKKNVGDGFIHGFEAGAQYRFQPEFVLFGSVAWTEGLVDTYPTSAQVLEREPVSRLMPLTGHLGIRWENPDKVQWVEASCDMADNQDRLSTSDKLDTQRIPPGGTPGYAVFNLRSGWELKDGLIFSVAVENIFNKDYRTHGSGQNEPGINVIMGLDVRF